MTINGGKDRAVGLLERQCEHIIAFVTSCIEIHAPNSGAQKALEDVTDGIRAGFMAAAIEADKATGWRPISEAPQDQTPILAIHENNMAGNMHVCWRDAIGSKYYLNPRTGDVWLPTHWKSIWPPNLGAVQPIVTEGGQR